MIIQGFITPVDLHYSNTAKLDLCHSYNLKKYRYLKDTWFCLSLVSVAKFSAGCNLCLFRNQRPKTQLASTGACLFG